MALKNSELLNVRYFTWPREKEKWFWGVKLNTNMLLTFGNMLDRCIRMSSLGVGDTIHAFNMIFIWKCYPCLRRLRIYGKCIFQWLIIDSQTREIKKILPECYRIDRKIQFHIASSYNSEKFLLLCLVLVSIHHKQVLIADWFSMASVFQEAFYVERGAHILLKNRLKLSKTCSRLSTVMWKRRAHHWNGCSQRWKNFCCCKWRCKYSGWVTFYCSMSRVHVIRCC